jgi:hypothetical protein
MNAGTTLTNNTATANGGGLHNTGTFTMGNVTISGNKALNGNGGGIYKDSSTTFTMSTGTISGNEALHGGGVYNNTGAFTLSGGTIGGTNRAERGGGVYIRAGSFTMSGSSTVINGNEATRFGGGVYVEGGAFNMTGGIIENNNAVIEAHSSGTGSGGGVYVFDEFTMTGGIIKNNNAEYNGGGVFFEGSSTTLGGTAIIKGNTRTSDSSINNVHLLSGKFITLGTGANAPALGMEIWVNTATSSGIIVESGVTIPVAGYFYADEVGKWTVLQGSQLVIADMPAGAVILRNEGNLAVTDHANLEAALIQVGYVVGTYTIWINTNQNLAGHTGTQSTRESFLNISGTTIKLRNAGNQSTTVQLSSVGRMFTVSNGVTLTVENGITLRGRNSTEHPEGNNESVVHVSGGTFIMETGSVITGNENENSGGGVCITSGAFIMNGGTISGNTTTQNGGGVYVGTGTFTKTGGTIIGFGDANANTAGGSGHAAFHASTPAKIRTLTAGPGHNMDSAVMGAAGGWDH